jgi:hypothetical protein
MALIDTSGPAAGITVLRFSDHKVLKGMTGVISFLEEWIEKYEASKTNHPLAPASGGHGFG